MVARKGRVRPGRSEYEDRHAEDNHIPSTSDILRHQSCEKLSHIIAFGGATFAGIRLRASRGLEDQVVDAAICGSNLIGAEYSRSDLLGYI